MEGTTVRVYKVVTVKHPNCSTPYTFQVPAGLDLNVGDWVLCNTKAHETAQAARCITPSFMITNILLKELHGINPKQIKPVIAKLSPTVYTLPDPEGEAI